MAIQLRDTQFGHLVRHLSGRKLFRYPDEIDESLWETSIARGICEVPSESGTANNSSSSKEGEADGNGANIDPERSNYDNILGNGKDSCLVDWYGSADPEITDCADLCQNCC